MRTNLLGLVLIATGALPAFGQGQAAPTNPPPPRAGLTLTSPSFEDGGIVPTRHTQVDKNAVSPKLEWKNVLPNTASFTIILHDLETSISKTTEDVLHWMIFNIPGTARELAEGLPLSAELADGSIQAVSRGGQNGYRALGGGTGPYHHYVFELYSLDTKLPLGPKATRPEVLKAMDGHVLEKSALVGRYRRSE
jgi:Raf kinase inhibitor-like YbhB/YbcL family protein